MSVRLTKFHNGKRQSFIKEFGGNKWIAESPDQDCKTPEDCNGSETNGFGCLIFAIVLIVFIVCFIMW